jgi:2-hydroxy-6-oxonona-2,4-dienedioate hydrolase
LIEAHCVIDKFDATAQKHVITYGDTPVVWRCWGAGPPLVLLHGGYGSWLHWIKNLEGLSARFRLLVPDIPGHGESQPAPEDWTAQWMGAALAHGVEVLVPDDRPVVGAGFSMGGLVLGHLGAALGERLTHAVFIGPNGMGCSYPPMPKLASVRKLGPDPTPEALNAVHRHNLGALMLSSEQLADELAVAVQRRNIAYRPLNTEHLPISDVLARVLPLVAARFGGIWGALDAFCGPYLSERETALRLHEPSLDFRVVEGAGHWVNYEAPSVVNEMLCEMLIR